MLKELSRLSYLLRNGSMLLIFFSCEKSHDGDFYAIESHKKNKDFIKLYSPDCYIYSNKNTFQIENIFHYVDGELIEVKKPSAESLIYDKFDGERGFPERYDKYKFLSIAKRQNGILFFNDLYSIQFIKNDSIFVKTNKADKFLIFVGNIPK